MKWLLSLLIVLSCSSAFGAKFVNKTGCQVWVAEGTFHETAYNLGGPANPDSFSAKGWTVLNKDQSFETGATHLLALYKRSDGELIQLQLQRNDSKQDYAFPVKPDKDFNSKYFMGFPNTDALLEQYKGSGYLAWWFFPVNDLRVNSQSKSYEFIAPTPKDAINKFQMVGFTNSSKQRVPYFVLSNGTRNGPYTLEPSQSRWHSMGPLSTKLVVEFDEAPSISGNQNRRNSVEAFEVTLPAGQPNPGWQECRQYKFFDSGNAVALGTNN